MASLAAQASAGARFGVHPCLGDLGHKALGRPVGVAASCGVGRRGEDAAVAVMRQGAELCART